MASVKKSQFDIVRRPIITEKSATVGSAQNGVVFEVHPDANKSEIRSAVEKVFDVKVSCVRTMNCRGKIKRVGTRRGRRRDWKKAFITLEEGASLNIIEGL